MGGGGKGGGKLPTGPPNTMHLLQDIILLKLEGLVSVFFAPFNVFIDYLSLKSSCSKWTHITILRMTKATNFRLVN